MLRASSAPPLATAALAASVVAASPLPAFAQTAPEPPVPPGATAQPAPEPAAPAQAGTYPRQTVEIHPALGFGNAVCDNSKPDSDCPVDGAFALALGGGWRFHDHWSVGLELAGWRFAVRESWRGKLADTATDVKFSSSYLGPYARWYWWRGARADPYLHAGLGIGSVTGEAKNAGSTYVYRSSGPTFGLGIGVEWQLTSIFRLGPQALAYLHVGNEICEKAGSDPETCRSPKENANGEREGVALPWRLILVGTFTLGGR